MPEINFFGNNRGIAIYENYILISADVGVKFGECEYNYPNALYLCKFIINECDQFEITNLQPIITYDYKRDGYQQANLLILPSSDGDEIYITVNVDKLPAAYLNSTNNIITENNLPKGYYLIYLNQNLYKSVEFYDGYDNIYMTYDNGFIYYYSTFTGDVKYNNVTYTSTTNVQSFILKNPRKTINGDLKILNFPIKNLFVNGSNMIIYGNKEESYFKAVGNLESNNFNVVTYENQKLIDSYYNTQNEYILYMENEKIKFKVVENVIYELDLNTDPIYLVDYKINYDKLSNIYNITGCNVGDLNIQNCLNIDKEDNSSYLFIINFNNNILTSVSTIDNIFDLSEQYSFFNNYLLYILSNNKCMNMEGNVIKNFVFNKISYSECGKYQEQIQTCECGNCTNNDSDRDSETNSVGSWHN